jgi:L-alanine-DL-glutamate epimerase-like enolase superfamily enzyme
MIIKTIESFVVRIPYDEDKPKWGAGFWAKDPQQHPGLSASHPGDISTEYPPLWRNRAVYTPFNESVVVKITTDDGIVGWGEGHAPIAGTVTKQAIDTLLAPVVCNRDPLDIHPLWEAMYSTMRMRGHSSGFLMEAISAIDIALHDIAGKALGVPIAALLGSQLRDRVPVYASSLPRIHAENRDEDTQKLIEYARALVAAGHRALKIKLGVDPAPDIALLRQLRAALGDEIGIAVDVNGAYDIALARRAGQLLNEAAHILWLEEPLPPENRRDYTRLAEFLDVAVAGGESLYNRWVFNDYLAAGAFDVVTPDVGRAGGISECRRIAMLADTYGVPFAPHVSTGTAITIAASLQWAASGANLMLCEWSLHQDQAGNGILRQPFEFADGFVHVPNAPGLGIDLNEAALRQWEV